MSGHVPISKNNEQELPIPTLWRENIREIVYFIHKLSSRNFSFPDYLDDVSGCTIISIGKTLAEYGCPIDPASASTWATSICRWMDGYWQVLIDLFSEGEQTDLVLFLRVTETGEKYRFRIESVHVP